MPVHDFNAERLFVDAPLALGRHIDCSREQMNYLVNVLRLKAGDQILVFNGVDGEWLTRLVDVKKRSCRLEVVEPARTQQNGPDIFYLFAPLKRTRLDYMVQKAVEMGVARLQPVLTQRTIADRVNLERMRSNVVEAAEQCGILHIAEVCEPVKLSAELARWDGERRLIYCDELAPVADPIEALRQIEPGPLAVLIGPEGGFSPEEREMLAGLGAATAISLGPRIMRADTAAVAALAVVNAVLGDWASSPSCPGK